MRPSENMQAIIERMYQVFDRYPVPSQFDVCLACCVSIKDEQSLRQTPLRHLSPEVLYEYNSSARSTQQDADEIRYLLPRLLELIAQGKEPAICQELCLERVANAALESWPDNERDLLADYARQYIVDLLDEAERKAELALLGDALVMFYLGGLDVMPLLDAVLEQPGFWAIASLAFFLYMERNNGQVCNAFVSGAKGRRLCRAISAWADASRDRLTKRAAEAIAGPPDSLAMHYERYYCGANVGYWIEESLCALHDDQTNG